MRFFCVSVLVALFSVSAFSAPKAQDDVLDVAIVGGGVSGLYTGYRLTSDPASAPKKVTLFEISHRLGGRIWSVKIPGSDHLVADIGAIRFLTSQKNISGLVKDKLQLETYAFSSSNNLEYFRDHHFVYGDYQNKTNFPQKIPYFLRDNEIGRTPSQLIDSVYHRLFPELISVKDPKKIKSVLRGKKDVLGQPLYTWNSRNLLGRYLSNEATHLLYDGVGFKPEFDEANAYEFFEDIGSLTDVKYLTVRGGMQTIPLALADRFKKNGGQIRLDQKLYTFSMVKHKGEELIKLELGPPRLHQPNQVVFARKLVLAMPQRAIQLLHPTPKIFAGDTFQKNLNSASPRPLGRVFLSYETAWWKTSPLMAIENGKSNTDLPMQQCYYLGSEQGSSGAKNALLFATSHNGDDLIYWRNYFARGLENSDPEYIANYKTELPKPLLQDLRRQLEQLHGTKVPLPKFGVYMEWSQNPFGAAYHGWRPHIKPWEVIPYMRHPIKEVPVYIIGESFSSVHGWIEGAINSAEKLLQEQFGLPQATWIEKGYDLGD